MKNEDPKDDKSRSGRTRNNVSKPPAVAEATSQDEAEEKDTASKSEASKSEVAKSEAAKSEVAKSEAAKSAEFILAGETPVTEKPVPTSPAKRTSQYLVTVDNLTGLPTKIEKLDEEGSPKELSKSEYLQVLSYANSQAAVSYSAPWTGNPGLAQQYYQGVLDCLKRFS